MENVTTLFSTRLKKLRRKRNQNDVAKEIGISRGALSYYESGERRPDINILYALAKYYHVSSDYLLGLTDVPVFNIEQQAIAKETGLSERSLSNLKLLTNTSHLKKGVDPETAIHRFLMLKAINLILEAEEEDLLNNLTFYFFVHFTHFGDWFDETEDSHPISDLSLYDNLLHIGYSEDYDFFSNAFLLMIEKNLRHIREKYILEISEYLQEYQDNELSSIETYKLIKNFFEKYQSSSNPFKI